MCLRKPGRRNLDAHPVSRAWTCQLGVSVWTLSSSLAGDEMQFGPVPRRCSQAGGVVQAPQKRIRYLRVGMPGKLRRYNRLISIADVFVFQGLASRS